MVTRVPPSGGPATGVTWRGVNNQSQGGTCECFVESDIEGCFSLQLWSCLIDIINVHRFLWMLKGKYALSVQVAVKAIKSARHACIHRMSEHTMSHCAKSVL